MNETTHQLVIERDYRHPVGKVFAAWSDPRLIQRWFAPGEMQVAEANVDFRPGGNYRIVMSGESNHIVVGQYSTIKADELICCSWRWEGSDVETRLVVEFAATDDGCRVTLTHSEFPDAELRDQHDQGWNGCLAKFEPALDAEAA